MRLGGSKNHVSGKHVSGGHTTLIDVADRIVKEMAKHNLFDSVRPAEICRAEGGRISVTIRALADEHVDTLRVLFRQSGVIQEVFFHVKNFRERHDDVIGTIKKIVRDEYPGTEAKDHTLDTTINVSETPAKPSPEALRLLEKYKNNKNKK